jgi:nitrogen fixation protein FixH
MNHRSTNTGLFWALFPVVLLGSLVGMVLFSVHVAVSDPSFAVEEKYYSRATTWDEQLAANRRSSALGWRSNVVTATSPSGQTNLMVSLVDRDGHPVQGANIDVEAFAVARSRRVVRAALHEEAAGQYRASLPTDHAGRWQLSLDATRGEDRFASTVRRDLPEATR